MISEILHSCFIIFVTFICSLFITHYMKKIAFYIGAVDIPRTDDNNRHIHKNIMPKLGGVGIFLSFLLGYMLFGEQSMQMNAILIGSFIMILTGICDDLKPIKPVHKLIGQIIAACVIAFYGNILLNDISVFGLTFEFGILSYPITIFFIVACSNIINLIDGLDGLSAGICSIFFITISIICLFQGRYGTLVLTLSLLMLGSTFGFLVHNFYPASIFAGDCATFLGYMISVITLLEFKGPALISFFIPVMILGIPIIDTLFAIIRRLLKGQTPFQGDRAHMHHQLLGMNLSQRQAVLVMYFINILFALASIFYVLKDAVVGIIFYIIILFIVLWFVFNTTIISDNYPERTKKISSKLTHKYSKKKK